MSDKEAMNLPTGEGPDKEKPENLSLPTPEMPPVAVPIDEEVVTEEAVLQSDAPAEAKDLVAEQAEEVVPVNESTPETEAVIADTSIEDPIAELEEAEIADAGPEAETAEPETALAPLAEEALETPIAEEAAPEVMPTTEAESTEVDPEPVPSEAVEAEEPQASTEPAPVEAAAAPEEKAAEPDISDEETDARDLERAKEEASVLIPADHPVDEDDDEDEEEEAETKEEDIIPDYSSFSKQELVTALEEIVGQDDINIIKKRVSMIRLAYNDLLKAEKVHEEESDTETDDATPQPRVEDPLNRQFEAAFGLFKQKRAKQSEDLEKQKITNLAAKNALLEDLRVLVASEESLKKTYDEFRDLQQKWKDIGIVPRNEVSNLWQNYHFLVEKFFDKVRINKELRDLDLKKNLEEKVSLCEKAEELILENSVARSFKMLQQYHQEWKAIGPVPHEHKDEIWERFKSASEKINVRRREHYLQSKEEQEANLAAKNALCVKMDELLLIENTTIKDWNTRTDEVKEYFQLWKSIGAGPKSDNDEVWEKFKTSVDRFYAEKSDYFGKLKEEQTLNYNQKIDICLQAEAMKDSSDWKETTHALINLQKDWKKIGPVPRRHADKIWKRFRTACDEFFNRKNEYFSNIKDHEKTNLEAKQALILEVQEYAFGENKSENLNVLKDFQRKWMDIGHVPYKDKESIQSAFRGAIDKRMEELRISSSEFAEMNYKSRLEKMIDSPDANRLIGKERQHLYNKIAKMESDIILWENNLGFLASSKKADLLKKEFENKIQKAKDEVALMKVKLRALRDS